MSKTPEGAFFRTLSADEEKEFRQWIRDNQGLHQELDDMWHPVIRDEWHKINREKRDKLKKEVYHKLRDVLAKAKEVGVLDDLEAYMHLDLIEAFCRNLDRMEFEGLVATRYYHD